ncbi:MAG TPA: transposase [Bacteroidales bacterium]|nr:transposase [Bacteroidales bacterium]
MSLAYKIIDQTKLYFVTFRVTGWVDIFTRDSYRNIIIDNLEFCIQNKGLEIYAWVLMSNHLHLLLKSNTGNLSGTIRDFKSYTGKMIINEIINGTESRKEWMLKLFLRKSSDDNKHGQYQVWAHNNHAEIIDSDKFIEQKLEYIHMNPVRNGLVVRPEDYRYSSAVDYSGDKGMLTINRIILKWKTYR